MQMLGSDYKEELANGKVRLFLRNGIFQARIYKGERSYIYRSLKTSELATARVAALTLLGKLEYQIATGQPISSVTMTKLIDEYVALRQQQYDLSQLGKAKGTKNTNDKNSTSVYMLYQIKRVVKFWREYCGSMAVENIDNEMLRKYIEWRKTYYHKIPKEKIPRNARLNPADKTLQWELMLGKAILKYAQDKGYRGTKPLPTYTLKGVKRIVRPAFTLQDYWKMISGMRKWIREADTDRKKYPRLLLRDYVYVLSNSGMRVGEANNLQWRDIVRFTDNKGRENYQLYVRGKTGTRTVTPRTNATRYIGRLMERHENREDSDYVFRMRNGSKVITLIDQFQAMLKYSGVTTNREGQRYTLYSLRHFYAMQALNRKNPLQIYDIAKNMGTSVTMIEHYYGKHEHGAELATRLG